LLESSFACLKFFGFFMVLWLFNQFECWNLFSDETCMLGWMVQSLEAFVVGSQLLQ